MNFDQYKEIIEFAISNEIEAQEFYDAAANKINDPYLKEMFKKFAEDEKGHEKILKGILSKDTIDQYFDESTDYKVAETVDKPELSTDMKPADAGALAMKNEVFLDLAVKYGVTSCIVNKMIDPDIIFTRKFPNNVHWGENMVSHLV